MLVINHYFNVKFIKRDQAEARYKKVWGQNYERQLWQRK